MKPSDQKKYISENYLKIPLKRMALNIGRSACFVKGEMARQGLITPKHIKEQFRRESQFSKGHISFNKGKKQHEFMSKESIERSTLTRFKKGRLPHNTKSDLDISLRKDCQGYEYYYIRISVSNWVLLHRYIWELIHGKIPTGFNVQFKDGNTLNVSINNLYLIDRKFQLRQNFQGGKILPFDLRQTIELIEKLKFKINEKQNNRSK